MLLQLGQQTVRANTIVFVLNRASSTSSKSTDADSTLAVFRSHGIPDEAGATLVARYPKILRLKCEKTLEPKLRFLRSTGLTGPELANVLLNNPYLLNRSVERTLVPYVEFLKSILPSEDDLRRVLRIRGLICAANIQILRDRGIPEQIICKIVVSYGISLCRNPSAFLVALERLKEVGLHHTNSNFAFGLVVVSMLSSSLFLRRVRVYRELGFPSDEDVYALFRKCPHCLAYTEDFLQRKVALFKELGLMSDAQVALLIRRYPRCLGLSNETFRRKVVLFKELGWTTEGMRATFLNKPQCLTLSEEMIRRKVAFLRDTVGWTTDILCSNPSLLGYSLENRMIPRCAVLNVLLSRGYVKMHTAMSVYRFFVSEERFRDEFVNEYREEVPLVLDAYEGKIEFRGWNRTVVEDEDGDEDEDEDESSNKKEQLLKALE